MAVECGDIFDFPKDSKHNVYGRDSIVVVLYLDRPELHGIPGGEPCWHCHQYEKLPSESMYLAGRDYRLFSDEDFAGLTKIGSFNDVLMKVVKESRTPC